METSIARLPTPAWWRRRWTPRRVSVLEVRRGLESETMQNANAIRRDMWCRPARFRWIRVSRQGSVRASLFAASEQAGDLEQHERGNRKNPSCERSRLFHGSIPGDATGAPASLMREEDRILSPAAIAKARKDHENRGRPRSFDAD